MENKRKDLRRLYEDVCEILGCNPEDDSRLRRNADARFVYFRVARERFPKDRFPNVTLEMIGDVVGRNYSDVIHGIKCANGIADIVHKYDYFIAEYREPMPEETLIELQ